MITKKAHQTKKYDVGIPKNILKLHDLSPSKILINFISGDLREINPLLSKISGIAHIGVEVGNIEKTVSALQTMYPKRKYEIIKKFQSVSTPKNFEGSRGIIAQVKPENIAYPALELFSIDWQGKYKKLPKTEREKLIQHIALRAIDPQYVQKIIDNLSKTERIKDIVPVQINKEAGEVFGYLINDAGEKLEIVSQI